MASQILCRLFPKTLTLTAIYSRSLSTTSSRRVLLPPSSHSLSTWATIGPSPNCSALKLHNGCDYYQHLVVMQAPHIGFFRRLLKGEPTWEEIVHSYVKTLVDLVGSEDEARMMVYKIHINSTNTEYGLGTLLSQDIFHRVEALPRVVTILPDDPSLNSKIIDQMPLPRSVRKFR